MEDKDEKYRRREAGAFFRAKVKSVKTKKGIPTVLLFDGKRYILDPEEGRRIF